MDDLISRQAVLKLLSTMPPEEAMTKALLIQSVKQMDVAQPETHDKRTDTHACDLIDRQAAIDALDRNFILGQGLLNDTLDHIADAKMEVEHGE